MDRDTAQQVAEARLLLEARKELYGETDPATLDAMFHLARTLQIAESYQEAEAVLRASLAIQNRLDEANGARMTQTEFNLAIVLGRLGEDDPARRLWQKVLEASDRTDGPESVLSNRAAFNLAITLRKLRRYGDEFPLRVRLLDSTRRSLGHEHVDTYRSMVDLAQTHRNLGNHEMALSLFKEAVDGLERNGADARTVLYQKWAIASELVALKRHKEASEMFEQVVGGAIDQLDPNDPFRRSAMRQQRAYRLLGRFSALGRRSRRQGKASS